jgi:hypothetical protein
VIAQLVRLAGALFAQERFSDSAVQQTKERMRNREIGVDADGTFEKRDSRCRRWRVYRSAVRLQRIQRGGGGILERRRVLLDGCERFADARPEFRRQLGEDAQNVFFACRLELLLVEQIPGRAVLARTAPPCSPLSSPPPSPSSNGPASNGFDLCDISHVAPMPPVISTGRHSSRTTARAKRTPTS